MSRWRAWLAAIVAVAAVAYLGLMVWTGTRPVQRQFVPFEAKGVLTVAPERILRVALVRGDQQVVLERTGEATWVRRDGSAVEDAVGGRLSTAVGMMQRSAPVRRLEQAELEGVDISAYGLRPPQLSVALFAEGERPVLVARFGGRNPDDFLQYMQVAGDPHVYLMSRFIGEEWRQALDGLAGP